MRILLVDDHPIVRRGIRTALLERFRDATIAEAGDAAAALDRIEREAWDVVLLDISLPGPSGLDLLKQLRHSHSGLPVLVISMHPAVQFARRALGAGARGYLTKDSSPEEFVAAIEQVRRGRRYVGQQATGAIAHAPRADDQLPHDALSDREYQVLRLLGSGRTVSDISRALGLSVKTISTYRTRTLDKLGMRTNAELMRYALENSLLET